MDHYSLGHLSGKAFEEVFLIFIFDLRSVLQPDHMKLGFGPDQIGAIFINRSFFIFMDSDIGP